MALIQINELNVDLVGRYGRRLHLPHLERLLAGSMVHTRSESAEALLEPWIQWPSVYTGLPAAGHGLRRLGDAADQAPLQLFEELERHGLRVGALSPINACNRLQRAAYFLPDPWTDTPSDSAWWSRRLQAAVGQMVNDNAKGRASVTSLATLALAAARFTRADSLIDQARLVLGAHGRPWRKALVLDLLLADLHRALWHSRQPDFASVFLNAGAHIQHHYLLASPAVHASLRNPEGYLRPGDDPVGEMLLVYDRLLGRLLAVPGQEWIVATGLSQTPYETRSCYWRLRDHAAFLRAAGAACVRVLPRMSRDFLVECVDSQQALAAQRVLEGLRVHTSVGPGDPLFAEIDNRGASLFVTLTYPGAVDASHHVQLDGRTTPLAPLVALVALKNGQHQARGYAFFSPGAAQFAPADGAHVARLHDAVLGFFGLARPQPSSLAPHGATVPARADHKELA